MHVNWCACTSSEWWWCSVTCCLSQDQDLDQASGLDPSLATGILSFLIVYCIQCLDTMEKLNSNINFGLKLLCYNTSAFENHPFPLYPCLNTDMLNSGHSIWWYVKWRLGLSYNLTCGEDIWNEDEISTCRSIAVTTQSIAVHLKPDIYIIIHVNINLFEKDEWAHEVLLQWFPQMILHLIQQLSHPPTSAVPVTNLVSVECKAYVRYHCTDIYGGFTIIPPLFPVH